MYSAVLFTSLHTPAAGEVVKILAGEEDARFEMQLL
jgi:hypothetical protein